MWYLGKPPYCRILLALSQLVYFIGIMRSLYGYRQRPGYSGLHCSWIKSDTIVVFESFRKHLVNKTKNTTHGMRDKNEKHIPIIPAVDGMTISAPDIVPHIPSALLKRGCFKISFE